jgi:hypothetical protein
MMRDQGFKVLPAPENNDTFVLEFPIKAPEDCKTSRDDSAMGQLEWYRTLVESWAEHNVSCTVYVRDNSMVTQMPVLDFSQLPKYEERDMTTGHYELACAGNACEFSLQ